MTAPATVRRDTSRAWVPIALVALLLVPTLAGSLRLLQLAGGAAVLPEDPRFAASPVPLVVHIVSAILYGVVGAFQFSDRFRRRRPDWHRAAGRALVVLGLMVALSALTLTILYPYKPHTGELLYAFRLAAGSAMAASIVLGFAAIRRRDITSHRAWMTRAYALAVAAGTQVFTEGIGAALVGSGEPATDLALGAGWIINLAVAEYVLRRSRSRRQRSPRAGQRHPAQISSMS